MEPEDSKLSILISYIKYYLFDKWRKDKCENCHGSRGGVRGNENIVNGKILCDYCSCDLIDFKKYSDTIDIKKIR